MLKVVVVRLLIFLSCIPSVSLFAKTRWEVAVVFLAAHENIDYQKDIDHNILELARAHPNEYFRLSIYREFKDRSIQYFVNPQAKPVSKWDPLFQFSPPVSVRVPGVVIEKKTGFKLSFSYSKSTRTQRVFFRGLP